MYRAAAPQPSSRNPDLLEYRTETKARRESYHINYVSINRWLERPLSNSVEQSGFDARE